MPPSAKIPALLLLIAVIVLAGWWIFRTYFDTYHLVTVRDGVLYRDGVRSLSQFQLAARRTHVKTIVSLVDDNEIQHPPFTDETAYCAANGIQIIRIPITLGGWPSSDQIQQFLAIAQDQTKQPVLVHCAQGVRRTGMLVAAYEMSVLKHDKTAALAEIQAFGHSNRTINDVQRFIQTYDPDKQAMTESLPPSQE
jgi:protein tyrosine/serine phosphatase